MAQQKFWKGMPCSVLATKVSEHGRHCVIDTPRGRQFIPETHLCDEQYPQQPQSGGASPAAQNARMAMLEQQLAELKQANAAMLEQVARALPQNQAEG